MRFLRRYFLIIFIITGCYTQNDISGKIAMKEGLYFGRQGGFLPPSDLVFVEYRGGILYAECYYPFKASVFKILGDTLKSADHELSFIGESSIVFIKNGNIIFQTNESFTDLKIKEVLLEYAPNEYDRLNRYRKEAIPYKLWISH